MFTEVGSLKNQKIVKIKNNERWNVSKKRGDWKVSDECENGTIITTRADTYAAVTCGKTMIHSGVDTRVGF